MILVELPIFSLIEEDFLRYFFNCWEGPIKIKAGHPLGGGIRAAVIPSYQKQKHSCETRLLKIAVPDHPRLHLSRYPYHHITLQEAFRIEEIVMSAYWAEVNRAVSISRRRTHKLKPAIDLFLDALELVSGDYKLSINYEQIRKMITRDDNRLRNILKEYNKNTMYESYT